MRSRRAWGAGTPGAHRAEVPPRPADHTALTQRLDEVLHVQAERVDGRGPALVLLLVDGDCGQPAAHAALLVHVQLHLRPEVLLQEVGDGRAAQPGAHHGCGQRGAAVGGAPEARCRSPAGLRAPRPAPPDPTRPDPSLPTLRGGARAAMGTASRAARAGSSSAARGAAMARAAWEAAGLGGTAPRGRHGPEPPGCEHGTARPLRSGARVRTRGGAPRSVPGEEAGGPRGVGAPGRARRCL